MRRVSRDTPVIPRLFTLPPLMPFLVTVRGLALRSFPLPFLVTLLVPPVSRRHSLSESRYAGVTGRGETGGGTRYGE